MQSTASAADPSGAWRDIGRPGAIAGGLLLAAYLILGVQWSLPLPRDLNDYVLGRDFLNFWTYGREAWSAEAGRFYDIVRYNEHLKALVPWPYPTQQWSYPPHQLLFAAPFGLLPYTAAYALWTLLGVAAIYFVAFKPGDDPRLALALVLAPAALVGAISGQNAFFTAAILIAAFRWMDERPLLVGALIGVLTLKPQLGILLPLMLILTGRWRVFFAAAVTTLLLAGATALIYGPAIWTDYLARGVPLQEHVLHDPSWIIKGFMPTVFMNARVAGLPADVAYALQAAVATVMIAGLIWVYAKPRDPLLSFGFLLVATVSATPYLMSYDLLVVAWFVLVLESSRSLTPATRYLSFALYWLPFIAFAMAMGGVPGSALIPIAVAAALLDTMRRQALVSGGAAIPVPSATAR